MPEAPSPSAHGNIFGSLDSPEHLRPESGDNVQRGPPNAPCTDQPSGLEISQPTPPTDTVDVFGPVVSPDTRVPPTSDDRDGNTGSTTPLAAAPVPTPHVFDSVASADARMPPTPDDGDGNIGSTTPPAAAPVPTPHVSRPTSAGALEQHHTGTPESPAMAPDVQPEFARKAGDGPRLADLHVARMPERLRSQHDTPDKKSIDRGDTFLSHLQADAAAGMPNYIPRSPISNTHYDVGLTSRTPPPPVHGGRPWEDWVDNEVTNEQWALPEQPTPPKAPRRHQVVVESIRPHRFLRPVEHGVDTHSSAPSTSTSAPLNSAHPSVRRQVQSTAAKSSAVYEDATKDKDGDWQMSDDDEYIPPVASSCNACALADEEEDAEGDDDEEDDDEPSDQGTGASATSKNKGKGRGRPNKEVSLEIECVGHKMQAELVALAAKHGLLYATILKKIGFTTQEVREPTLANIFRQVHKDRLVAKALPKETSTAFNEAWKAWQLEHGSDPQAVQELLTEHAAFLQMAALSNSYFMAHNIAVVGAVIHLGPSHSAQTFAPNLSQQVALIKGFDVQDEQMMLLKAKASLILQAEEDRRAAASGDAEGSTFWQVGSNPRDMLRGLVKSYLNDALAKFQSDPPPKWEEKRWPQLALALDLVLVGWGSNMPSLPTQNWIERTKGALTRANWQQLVNRIPKSWHNNPHHNVDENELPLKFMLLEDFLIGWPEHGGPERDPSSSQSSDEEISDAESTSNHRTHFIPAGTATPSGKHPKRTHVTRSILPIGRAVSRPTKPMPARRASEPRKRKHSVTAPAEEPEQRLQQLTPVMQPVMLPQHVDHGFGPLHDPLNMGGFLQQGNNTVVPNFHPQFPPAPFGLQPPYTQHGAFHGQGYPPPFYPPQYAHPAWTGPQPHNPPQVNNAPQQWGGQVPYTSEDVDAMLQQRHGGYGHQ
ncbi:hypothetical protein FIBSPDRAFT_965240 [Athelia psychrophila]|uniref:Uncharacterized protein n=1 Tax=Athelia psychrophila TaxID=1759441 RepID=A0A165WTS3_9AGAM|nr:hypothetical protein FIBSPDRAFT_965240 [Fibularhizoctonia sp. CBS 109695]